MIVRDEFELGEVEWDMELIDVCEKLLSICNKWIWFGKDDKVIVCWNGLMIELMV